MCDKITLLIKMVIINVALAIMIYFIMSAIVPIVAHADMFHNCTIQVYSDSASSPQVQMSSNEVPEGDVYSINVGINESFRQAFYHSWVFDADINDGQVDAIIYYADRNGTIDKNIAQALSLFWGIVCGYVFFKGIGRG